MHEQLIDGVPQTGRASRAPAGHAPHLDEPLRALPLQHQAHVDAVRPLGAQRGREMAVVAAGCAGRGAGPALERVDRRPRGARGDLQMAEQDA